MSQLTIYKASAGSGKTYRLVLEYLKLLMETPINYKHILAVTFTNKATAEMKERVLRDLHKLARGKNDSLLLDLQKETGLPAAKISENAQRALSMILHDYDHFSISTIDSFFQKVLRSFAREAGLYGTYEISIEQQAVMEEACDRMLLAVENDKELRKWLITMSEEQLEAGKNWQVNQQIFILGKQLYNEAFQPYLLQHEGIDIEREKIRSLRKSLQAVKKDFEINLATKGQEGLDLISRCGLVLSDFKGGSRTFLNYFVYWAQQRTDKLEPTATLLKAVDEPEQWATGKSEKRTQILEAYHSGLNEHLRSTLAFIKENEAHYITAVELLRYLHALGVLTTLLSKVREIGQERNAMLLSEGTALLRGIIGNNDAPFVYEKTGSYFKHFMIDEFQDTSLNQWENFKPLVANSLSENNANLVVGDVKQSIYRWRNSDWQLLDHQIQNDLKTFKIEEVALDGNWRSAENLVKFNNQFFVLASQLLQQQFNAIIPDNMNELDFSQTIEHAYKDVSQNAKRSLAGGFMQCTFLDAKEFETQMLPKMIDTVKKMQDLGYKARDIAILVRQNKEGKQVAEALLNAKKQDQQYNFEVISDDSLFLETSAAVRMLVQLFKHVLQPRDEIVKANIVHEFNAFLLPALKALDKQPRRFVAQVQTSIDFDSDVADGEQFIPSRLIADYFPFFFQAALKYQVQQWSFRSLIDLTDELIDRYNLVYLAGEQANLQAFKDVINDFSKREGGNLRQFIEWWDEFGSSIKLQTAGDRDAIRIMTIHKAKGLEFPVVIIPYADWGFEPRSNQDNILWCSTKNTPYEAFPVLPVKMSKVLGKSHFARDYYTEVLLSYIDNLNLLYVAQTRAVDALFLFADNAAGELKTVSQLYLQLLKNHQVEVFPKEIEPDTFSMGNLQAKGLKIPGNAAELDLSSPVQVRRNLQDALKLKQNFQDFFEADQKRTVKINQGKLVHELFSYIETAAELESALIQMLQQGKAGADELEELAGDIHRYLDHPLAQDWFSGVYKVMNERTILLPGFELQRPDRIMEGKGKVVVLDYKLSNVKHKAHFEQVKSYCASIGAMGYAKVEGYLWYLKSNEIINVYDHA